MPRMIELMRQSAVPANIMRAAAHGALSLPPAEIIEILVFLTRHPIFGEQARMTLAQWDEAACLAAASDPNTPREVLDYLMAPENRRPSLVPALIENPSVPEMALLQMAQTGFREAISMLLASARVKRSPSVLHALFTNQYVTAPELQQIKEAAAASGDTLPDPGDDVLDFEISQYLREHAAEIAAEEGKPFELIGGMDDILDPALFTAEPVAAGAAAAAAAPEKDPKAVRERISVFQKIAKLTVGERVQLAMKGTKDERFILIRDGCKVVAVAVLESPKVSDSEAELFASMKNVQEVVLRGIAQKRKFMKLYAVIRTLASNPRCPLDVSLTLLSHLLVNDLKNLSQNKNVADTLRKLALKMWREKSAARKH